jgi:hypothetical protein
MIPCVQGACQDIRFVVPFIEKPLIGKDDDFAMLALGDLFDVLNASENRLVVEGQRTQESAQLIIAQMQHGFAALAKENDHLRTQLIASEGRQREVEVIHKAEVKALKDEVLAAQESVKTVRKEMLQVSQKADSNVAAALAAQKIAVEAMARVADARVASALTTQQAAVHAAIQAGDARVVEANANAAWRRLGVRNHLLSSQTQFQNSSDWYARNYKGTPKWDNYVMAHIETGRAARSLDYPISQLKD